MVCVRPCLIITISITSIPFFLLLQALARVDKVRASTIHVGKDWAARAAKAQTKAEALKLHQDGFDDLPRHFRRNGDHPLEKLKYIAMQLRKLPAVEVDLSILALVGAPNVGKSSLVQVLSTGVPEVANYPFTTRSIKMGHFFVDGLKHQITDTPGLLDRPQEERNSMEKLTLAVLEHLNSTAIFVVDLTEGCGTSLQEQWNLRKELRTRFPNKSWIDVMSKSDLLTPEMCQKALVEAPGCLFVSSITEEGLEALKGTVLQVLEEKQPPPPAPPTPPTPPTPQQ